MNAETPVASEVGGTYDPDPWQTRANCATADPDEMQPEAATPEQIAASIAYWCDDCPVVTQCRELAEGQADTSHPDVGAYGIHAGSWWGRQPRMPRGADLVSDEELAAMFKEGLSIAKIAAEVGLSKAYVGRARQRLVAA